MVDFKNTILIMTSNLGTSLIGKRTSPGFLTESDEQSYEKMKERVMEEMKRAFRPEFLNRIDDIIVFHSLSEQHIKSIIRLMTTRINKQLTEKGIELILTPAAENALVEKGYDPTYGARQLRRTIQKHIEDPAGGGHRPRPTRRQRAYRGRRGRGQLRVPRSASPWPPTLRSSLLSTEPATRTSLTVSVTAAGRAVVRSSLLWSLPYSRPSLGAATSGPGPAASAPGAPRPILIRELAVEGNRRVQEAVILGRIRSAVGAPFNPSQASEDLRSDLRPRVLRRRPAQGGGLRGRREGDLRGDRAALRAGRGVRREHPGSAPADLQEKIDLKLGSVYNPVDVQRAREKLKEAYEDEGYFEVQISPEVEKFGDGDVKVVFTVNEGRRITIDKIVFRGNKGLKDKQIKDAMTTQERQYFILRGTVQRQKLEEDIERIVGVYQDNGYVQMRVERHDIVGGPRHGPGDDHDRRGGGRPVPGRHDQVHRA